MSFIMNENERYTTWCNHQLPTIPSTWLDAQACVGHYLFTKHIAQWDVVHIASANEPSTKCHHLTLALTRSNLTSRFGFRVIGEGRGKPISSHDTDTDTYLLPIAKY